MPTKRKFTGRTFISCPRNGSSRRELSFHAHETEVQGANFHFMPTKWKFTGRTSISCARNGSSRHELSFHAHEAEVCGTNFHFRARESNNCPEFQENQSVCGSGALISGPAALRSVQRLPGLKALRGGFNGICLAAYFSWLFHTAEPSPA